MKKTYQLDFQKIRRKTQIKDFASFELYLKNIFSDLAKRDYSEKDGKGIEKISFIDYMNLPFIVAEKLFNVLDKNRNGYLSQNEFVTGIINLYVGGLEETQKVIFKMLDFDLDGKIIPEDSRLLISFIKNLANPPNNVMKLKPRTTLTDEENLEEINSIIKNFFNNKRSLTYEEYKYNIENVNSDVFFLFICFLYNNKPFNESSIKILKLLNKNSQFVSSATSMISCTSDDCLNDSKFRIKSPSNMFKSFMTDLIDNIDLDEIQRDCCENSLEDDYLQIDENIMIQTQENFNKINLPQFKAKINLFRLKSNKDYVLYDVKNKEKVGSTLIKKSYDNFVKRMKDLVIEDDEGRIKKKISDKKSYAMEKDQRERSGSIDSKKKKNLFSKDYNENKLGKCQTLNQNVKIQVDKDSLVKDQPNKMNTEGNFPKIEIYRNDNNNLGSGNYQSSQISDIIKMNNTSTDIQNLSMKMGNSAKNLFNSGNEDSANEDIVISDIIYENYIFKSRNNNKLKKYYIVLIGMDLFYFSNSKKKKLRGMHNLSGSYIYNDDNVIKVREEYGKNQSEPSTVLYYPFKLYFKKKARIYYCPNEEEAKMWIKHIRLVTKFKEVKDYYDFGEDLGSGKFGKVKVGYTKQNRKKYAIKTINKAQLKGTEVEMVKTEIEIMKFCRHRNIVRLIDNFEDMENIYIVLEYLSGGNLNYFLSKQQTLLSEERIKDLIFQMASGIYYLHNFGIIHRDLKPENTMLTDISENAHVKIVDFGLSKILGITEKSNEAYGTLSYAAPEVILKNDYNNKVDIWSLGIIMYFLICGYLPFNDKNNNFSKIANDITKATIKYDPNIWGRISNESKDLVIKCLDRDLKKRLNILEFLEHSWFK